MTLFSTRKRNETIYRVSPEEHGEAVPDTAETEEIMEVNGK